MVDLEFNDTRTLAVMKPSAKGAGPLHLRRDCAARSGETGEGAVKSRDERGERPSNHIENRKRNRDASVAPALILETMAMPVQSHGKGAKAAGSDKRIQLWSNHVENREVVGK